MNEYGLSAKWKEAGKSPAWEPEKEGEKFFGIYVDKEEAVGPNKSNLYTFTRYEDQDFNRRMGEFCVWGSTVLDIRFKNFTKGEKVAIVYLGKEPSEKRKGSDYKNYKVFHEPPAMTEVKAEDVFFE